ncbi:MAG: hypothetical protein U0797_07200 [Gemmataceae bacterium]
MAQDVGSQVVADADDRRGPGQGLAEQPPLAGADEAAELGFAQRSCSVTTSGTPVPRQARLAWAAAVMPWAWTRA